MIRGTADPAALAATRPTVERLDAEAVTLPDAEILQALFEMPQSARESVVPPGCHPTNPAALVLIAWRCPTSPWGAFTMVQARAQVRSGTRPRGFVTAAWCDAAEPAAALAGSFGFPTRVGDVRFARRYDRVDLEVADRGTPILRLEAMDPDPLAPGDVQYSATLNLATTPRGVRLLQVEPGFTLTRAERLRPRLTAFDAGAFGDVALDPYHPVSASIATGDILIPPLRFVCRPDEMAFTGTEPV